MDGAAVVTGIDNGDIAALQLGQVLSSANFGQRLILLEQIFQGNCVGDLPALDQFAACFVDAAMRAVGEVVGPQKVGNLFVGTIVGEDSAQQCLLGLIVDRGLTKRIVFPRGLRQGRYVCVLIAIHDKQQYQNASASPTIALRIF